VITVSILDSHQQSTGTGAIIVCATHHGAAGVVTDGVRAIRLTAGAGVALR